MSRSDQPSSITSSISNTSSCYGDSDSLRSIASSSVVCAMRTDRLENDGRLLVQGERSYSSDQRGRGEDGLGLQGVEAQESGQSDGEDVWVDTAGTVLLERRPEQDRRSESTSPHSLLALSSVAVPQLHAPAASTSFDQDSTYDLMMPAPQYSILAPSHDRVERYYESGLPPIAAVDECRGMQRPEALPPSTSSSSYLSPTASSLSSRSRSSRSSGMFISVASGPLAELSNTYQVSRQPRYSSAQF